MVTRRERERRRVRGQWVGEGNKYVRGWESAREPRRTRPEKWRQERR